MLYQTRAHVHLEHIASNVAAVRERVGGRKVLVAVKADAYGHGAVPVARVLAERGLADWFGVATVPEGIELREAGIALPILKFTPTFPVEMVPAVEHGLTLSVGDLASATALAEAAARVDRRADVHLKVDTGMGRVGVRPQEAAALAATIDAQPHLRLEGVFTHLPISDHPSGEAFTAAQIESFAQVVGEIEDALGRRIDLVHAANSGGVLGPEAGWFDMVRPGVMVYGSYPDPEAPRTVPLLPGLSWLSAVSFVKDVAAGESIGYGRTWSAPTRTRIATVPVGYADGYDRRLSNRGEVLIGGRRLPVVGRVCMDQLMVDCGPDSTVAVGDEVVLIGASGGEQITAQDLAAWSGTIPYEVTCRISRRVPRLYDAP